MGDSDSADRPSTDRRTTGETDRETTAETDRGTTEETGARAESGPRSRTVTVPLRLYKTITVFSTLVAILGVVGGFVLIDAATNRTQAPVEEIDPVLAALGLALIVAGALVYAFSTRFRAEGMGKPKERSDEGSDDG